MIEVYKIGHRNYLKDGVLVDKNSGAFEYRIIRDELKDIICSKKVLVIINGKFVNDEESILNERLDEYDIKIFIASDIIALTDNKNIIDKCDFLLHQCPNNPIDGITIKQCYSWVPELFYKYNIGSASCAKIDRVIFGGGVRDNEELILSYLDAVPSTAFLKTDTVDNRLDYDQYMWQLSKHRYSLIVSRKKYSELNWVTARYAEALAVNTLPICDSNYDKSNHFAAIKVFNPDDLKSVVDMFNNNQVYRISTLRYMQQRLRENCDNFKDLILELVGEENDIYCR